MKKIILFFVMLLFFGVVTAQEGQNEPVAAQPENESAEPASPQESAEAAQQAEEPQPEEAVVPAEEPKPEGAKNESPAQNGKAAEEAPEPVGNKEAENDKPAEAAPAEDEDGNPEQPAELGKAACEPVPNNEKPKRVFYQPTLGVGLGASIFSFRFNNDIDFLIKHAKNGANVYIGLDVDFRYSPYLDDHSVYELPIQMNFTFDFPVTNRNVNRVSLWFSGGVDLAFGYLWYYDYRDRDDWDDDKDRDKIFRALFAWGFGVNLLFHNDIAMKIGFDSFYGKYPDLTVAVGYRF